jgi:hypothetical protein
MLTFELPLPPNLNGTGWRTTAFTLERAKKKYWKRLDDLYLTRQIPWAPPPAHRLNQVHAVATVRTCPVMDQDNAHRRMKWVWDWLQSRGYIVNDRAVRCDLTPVASGRKNQGITLTIEEAPDG